MNKTFRTNMRSSHIRNGAPQPQRRGVAMLLVLISLATATILTTAYLSSRDNSAEIGANVADSASARWSAMGGIELGIAIFQTEADWRTAHTNGVLLANHPLGNGSLDLLVEDLETGNPPTGSTTEVLLTSIATINGIDQTATATAHVPDEEQKGIDVDLSEFAVFTGETVTLKDQATITRWPTAPKSKLGRRLAMGTQSNGSGTVKLENNAAAIDTTVYHGPGASGSMVQSSSGSVPSTTGLLDNIPLPESPAFPVSPPHEDDEYKNVQLGFPFDLNSDHRVNDLEVSTSNGRLTLTGDVTFVANDDLRLRPDSGIYVDGNATVVVFDDVTLENNSFIELRDGATLTMYIGGAFRLDDAYVGDERADKSVRDASGGEGYMNPERIRIFGGSSAESWDTKDITVVKGNVYAPNASMKLTDTSALYGRIAANDLFMDKNAAVFYDHALNTGGGFTDPDSELYNSDGTLKTDVASLSTLSDAELAALASALGEDVKGLLGGLFDGGGGGGGGGDPIAPTDPTPRPLEVVASFDTRGQDPQTWESKSGSAVAVVTKQGTAKGAQLSGN